MQQVDDPPYLNVGTEVSAKYKGAFCEAKVRKVVRNIKCKVAYKQGLGSGTVSDDQIKGGTLRVGATVEVKHPDRREFVEATITKIQDCSQYTVVFDDGDITTLRRSALCLKSGRHFNESETLDQLPLTHPEHFGNPVIGGRRGRRSRQMPDDSSDEEEDQEQTTKIKNEKEEHIGKVVCVEGTETKKKGPKENWFPGLVVAPTAQVTVRIRVKDEYLVRSFKDGRYYTVPKKEATEFTRELAHKQEGLAVQAALEYLDNDVLPPHWDRDALFGLSASSSDYDQELDSDSSDDEPREEKDHFVAQLYKYMDDRGTPLNKAPSIINKDVDLYRLFRAVQKLGGYNRVTNQNQWKSIASRLGFAPATTSITNLVKQAYKKFLQPFEDFNRKLGCTMVAHPRANRIKGRSLLRANSVASPKPNDPKEGKSSIAADESADNSESSSTETSKRPELTKRKLSTSSGKVKALVDKFEEKSKEESIAPCPVVNEPETPAPVLAPISIPSPVRVSSPSPTAVVSPTPSILPIPPVVKQYPRSAKLIKEETIPLPMLPTTISLPSNKKQQIRKVDEKRGRKKKEPEPEKVESKIDGKDEGECSTDFPIEVGDKLKVLYHEQKVTYEAKVIEIRIENNSPSYLVHYTGWNTRYDEWVRKERIAENLTNSKAKRAKPPTKSGSNSSSSSTSSNCSNSINTITTTPINKSSAKRGRGGSRSDSQPPRSTTPSSIASNSSRTKSPATPAQRRTTRGQPNSARRTSNNTDISSLQTDTDTDSDEPVKKPTPKPNLSGSKGQSAGSNVNSTNTTPTSSTGNKSLPHHDDEILMGAKGRDYDLNQIRSELKGFKEIKSPSPDSDAPLSSSIGIEQKTDAFDITEKHIKIEASSTKSSEIIKSNTSSSEAKTSSDISSESDSFDAEDDSQSSSKLLSTIAKFTSEKTERSTSQLVEKSPVAAKLTTEKNIGKLTTQSTESSVIKQEKNLKEIQSENVQSGKLADKVSGKSFIPTEKTIFKSQKDCDNKFTEQKSPIKVNADVPIIKPSVKSNIPEKIIPIKVEKSNIAKKSNITNAEKIIKSGANEKLSKIIGLTEKNSFKSIAALQDKQLLTASSISLKESLKQTSLQSAASDVYEFKEPEPFEFESTTGRKPVPSTSTNISPENEKKGRKTANRLETDTSINELKSIVSGTSPGPSKKNKKLPSKDFEHITKTKVIKKEEKSSDEKPIIPIAAAAISQTVPVSCTPPFIMLVPNKTESAFDVLRKSPNFNIQNFGSCEESAPDGTVKPIAFAPDEKLYESVNLLTTKPLPAFANPLADCSSSSNNSSSIINSSSSNSNKTSIIGTATAIKEEILPKIFELKPTVDSNNDSKGKDENPIKELETVKKILLSNTDFDLEPPKIEKPSIADKVLKALNQQQQQQLSPVEQQPQQSQPPETRVKIENALITSSNRISPMSIEVASSLKIIKPFEPINITSVGYPIIQSNQQPPKIEIPLLPVIKKDVSAELVTRKPMLSSPEHKLDILESIAPKNNDLSETIQKLESAIQKASNIERFSQDSSDSTDSDQRLIIEDESQSSETNQAQTEFIAINKKDTDVSYGARKDLTKDKVFAKTTTKEDNSLTFSSRFQDNVMNVNQEIIATPLSSASSVGNIVPMYIIGNAQENMPKLFNVDIVKDLTPSPQPLKIELTNTDDNEIDVQLKIEKEDPTNPQIITSESSHNNETISLLLCEETIPGSPAPACGNIKEVSEILKKGFDMASTTSSSSTYSNPHPTTADIKPVPMDIENDTNPTSGAAITLPDATTTVVQIQQAPITAVPNTAATTSGTSLVTVTTAAAVAPTTTVTTAAATATPILTTPTTTVNTGGKPQDKTDAGCTSNSSPRDSISQDESKSDSEDLKHQDNDPEISPKKRRRPRKSSECDNPNNNNKRRKTTRQKAANAASSGNNGGNGSDSDENSDTMHASHRSSNAGRSGKPCQYNFLVQLDPAMNSNQRIAILKKKIQDLRKTYNTIKAELASIDRRRKKLRRREREIKRNANKINNS